jgi:hypothetical protein
MQLRKFRRSIPSPARPSLLADAGCFSSTGVAVGDALSERLPSDISFMGNSSTDANCGLLDLFRPQWE